MAGFKLKTRKAAAKRFRKSTARGKIVRSKGAHGHFLSKRGQKARNSQGTTMVHDSNFEQVNKLVPALGAKKKRSQAIKKDLKRAMAAKAEGGAAPVKAAKPAKASAAKPAAAKAAPAKKAAPKAAAKAAAAE